MYAHWLRMHLTERQCRDYTVHTSVQCIFAHMYIYIYEYAEYQSRQSSCHIHRCVTILYPMIFVSFIITNVQCPSKKKINKYNVRYYMKKHQ